MVLLSLWWVSAALAGVRTSADARAGNEEMVQIDLPVRRHREYELVTPISTNVEGHYLSHMLSASHKKRSARNVSSNPEQLFFNITAFGRGFHLRLKPNTQLVAPGAVVEWGESSPVPGDVTNPVNDHGPGSTSEGVWRTEPLQSTCAYVGDIVDIPGTSVAISNCDGLVGLLIVVKMKLQDWEEMILFYCCSVIVASSNLAQSGQMEAGMGRIGAVDSVDSAVLREYLLC